MLTPIDIQNKTFEVKFRGYSSQEVDDFMDLIMKDYETLYQENISLKDRVTVLSNAVEQYKKMEETLQNSIILAQKTGEDIKKTANEKANNIVHEAEMKADSLVREANANLSGLKNELNSITTEISNYKSRIKGICNGLLEMLDKME